MASREFNQRTNAAKAAASRGPVVITDRGKPCHVLLTYDDYLKLTGGPMSLARAFADMPNTGDIEADFPRSGELPRAAVFE